LAHDVGDKVELLVDPKGRHFGLADEASSYLHLLGIGQLLCHQVQKFYLACHILT